jgi:uncharacterized membrane protein HdeD (DUF308 family)
MDPDVRTVDLSALFSRWWVLVVRGAAAILFGLLAFSLPELSLLTLVLMWGGYVLVDGIFNLILAERRGRHGKRWGWLFFAGLVSLLAALFVFTSPRMSALALLVGIAVWAVVTGIAEVGAAARLRRQIRGEWLLGLSGLLSIAFGVFALVFPGQGALALLWAIASYAIAFGALLVALGLRIHQWDPRVQIPSRPTASRPAS